MAMILRDTIEPAGNFPAVKAKDVLMPNGQRLSEYEMSSGEYKKVVAEEQELAFGETSGMQVSAVTLVGQLVVGNTYKVVWGDEEFTCECYDKVEGDDITLNGLELGNASLIMETMPNTGEPFFVGSNDGENFSVIKRADDPTTTIAIYGGEEMVSKAYVRNYVEARLVGDTEITLFPEEEFNDFAPHSSYFGMYTKIIQPPTFALTVGETYRVVWNGEEFTCVGQDASALGISGAVAIGNLAAANIGSGNNEPFGIGVNANACILFSLENRAGNTVAVYGNAEPMATESFVKDYVEQYISEALGGDY